MKKATTDAKKAAANDKENGNGKATKSREAIQARSRREVPDRLN